MLMLGLNGLMLKYLVKSMRIIGSSMTIIINFVFNHFLSTILGLLVFNEGVSLMWMVGASSILIGVAILVVEKESTKGKIEKTD